MYTINKCNIKNYFNLCELTLNISMFENFIIFLDLSNRSQKIYIYLVDVSCNKVNLSQQW